MINLDTLPWHFLPQRIDQNDPEGGVMQPWTRKLPLRYQGVLVTAIRGCDGAPKEDPSKAIQRLLRRTVMNPAVSEETTFKRGFFGLDKSTIAEKVKDFLSSLDQYPLHYVMHIAHACEVIGLKHPDGNHQEIFSAIYHAICHKLHLNPETPQQLQYRLVDHDRVLSGTVERDF